MKITIIISDISKTGGTERAVATLANMLCKKSHDVNIVSLTRTNNKKSYYALSDNVHVDFLNNEPLPLSFYKKIKWCLNTVTLLHYYFKKKDPDFVISTGHNNNWLLPLVKIGKQTKKIACEHIVYSSIPFVSKVFMSLTYSYLDRIVVLSEKAKSSFSKYSKISVIPNALPFATHLQSSLIEKKILVVGRLSPEKGLERVIPIAINLRQNFPDWKIVVVGEGPERKKLEKLISEADLVDIVKLEGAKTDVERYYLNSSIYIMTSHYEAFPMVLLEAQSFGLPVIAFDCPEGPSQIINNYENGYLIENGNTDHFIEHVSLLIENDNLRNEFGQKAKTNSFKFSEEIIMNKWISLFNEMIN